ncbi:MAG: septum site-determining protein Ssd [Nocardioidaceae bacterium]
MKSSDDRGVRPLIVTTDELLLDDLLRLAAAAGATPEVAADVVAARRSWSTAGMVVIGHELVSQVAGLRLPRRDSVLVVSAQPGDPAVWAGALALGAEDVVTLPDRQVEVIDAFGDCLDGGGRRGTTIGVVSGCGGGGGTTFAAALALTAAGQGRTTLLVDADPLGGGIDLVLGCEDASGMRWPDLASTKGRLAAATLREALPRVHELSVLSWDRGAVLSIPAESMRSVVSAGQRGHDLLVVDLPRRLDAAAEEALIRASVTLLVVPAEVRAVAAASRVLSALREVAREVGLVVRGPGPSGLDAAAVAESLGADLWAQMRAERGVTRCLDEGLGPVRRRRGPLVGCCSTVLDSIAGRGAAAA